MIQKKTNFLLLILFLGIFLSNGSEALAARDVSGYAWSENIGWVNFDSGDIVNKGMNFIETGDYVQVPTIDISDTWTIEAWSFATNVADGNWNTLTRGSGDDHQIILEATTGALGMYDNVGGTGFISAGYDGTQLANSWHHIAVTGHDNVQDFYIDGDYVGSTSVQSKTDIYSIGNYFGGGQQWGALDEVRLWNDVRTQQEIRDNMWAELNGNESGLVGYWDFNEGTGSIVDDKTSNNNDGTVVGGTWYNNDYGVSVGDDNILTGYAWSENIGWISFQTSDLVGCPSGTCNARLESGKIVGWARQLNLADGWIKLGPNIVDLTDYGAYLSNNNILGYAWSDNFGWLSFSCENQGSCGTVQYGVSIEGNVSTSNYVTNINYCNHLSTPTVNTGLTVSFNWDYTGESPQDSYTIQVSTNSSFTSPFEVTADTASTSYILNLEGSGWNGEQLNWGSVYYWRVMVESEADDVSNWSSAQTINISRTHASPLVVFSNSPQIILEGRAITFIPQSGEIISQTYDASTPSYLWTFTGGDPETSTDSSVEVTFEESETYPVGLVITDDSGYYCEREEDVNAKIFNPIWRMVSPY